MVYSRNKGGDVNVNSHHQTFNVNSNFYRIPGQPLQLLSRPPSEVTVFGKG